MIDQAASQPLLATVALNLAWISSRDKVAVMEVRMCGATLPDVRLNIVSELGVVTSQDLKSHHMLVVYYLSQSSGLVTGRGLLRQSLEKRIRIHRH